MFDAIDVNKNGDIEMHELAALVGSEKAAVNLFACIDRIEARARATPPRRGGALAAAAAAVAAVVARARGRGDETLGPRFRALSRSPLSVLSKVDGAITIEEWIQFFANMWQMGGDALVDSAICNFENLLAVRSPPFPPSPTRRRRALDRRERDARRS